MSFEKEQHKTLNSVFVEPDTHIWLLIQANKAGMDLRYFAGMLLDRARSSYEAGVESNNDAVAVFDLLSKTRAKKSMIENVYAMASIYVEHMDDVEMAQNLADACERAELDFDSVLQTTRENPFSSIAQYEIGFTKMGDCIQWITQFMAENNQVPSHAIYAVAKTKGFTEKTVRRAISFINNHNQDYKIRSKRGGNGWYLVLQKEESTESKMAETLFSRKKIVDFDDAQTND